MDRKLKVSLVPREINGLRVIITSKEIPRVYNLPSDADRCLQKIEELARGS